MCTMVILISPFISFRHYNKELALHDLHGYCNKLHVLLEDLEKRVEDEGLREDGRGVAPAFSSAVTLCSPRRLWAAAL